MPTSSSELEDPPSALASHFLPMRNGSNDAMAQSSLALNPYMITSNQSYGLQLNELKKMNAMLEKDEIFEETKSQMKDDDATTTEKDDTSQSHNQNTNLSFLYTRESDRIGEGVQLSNYPLAKQFRQKKSKWPPGGAPWAKKLKLFSNRSPRSKTRESATEQLRLKKSKMAAGWGENESWSQNGRDVPKRANLQ